MDVDQHDGGAKEDGGDGGEGGVSANQLGNSHRRDDKDGDQTNPGSTIHSKQPGDSNSNINNSSSNNLQQQNQPPLISNNKTNIWNPPKSPSPNFYPRSHTLSHIANKTNIKRIGTNVSSVSGDTNGLDRLVLGMEQIQLASVRSERLLRESREAVAEKLRIQRLLTRLDALLSLPQTLQMYIHQGKYRMTVQSHQSATEILGRHSAGFESLRSIELEDGILESTTLYGVSFQVSDDHFIGSSPSSKSPAEEGNAKE